MSGLLVALGLTCGLLVCHTRLAWHATCWQTLQASKTECGKLPVVLACCCCDRSGYL
jgi:hypothetical protein